MDRGRGHAACSSKSFIARVTRDGSRHKVLGVVLNDGTPIKSVEVEWTTVRGSRRRWTRRRRDKYSWKLFTYTWTGATPGEHTLVSRVTDVNGQVQPTDGGAREQEDVPRGQLAYPRKVMVT